MATTEAGDNLVTAVLQPITDEEFASAASGPKDVLDASVSSDTLSGSSLVDKEATKDEDRVVDNGSATQPIVDGDVLNDMLQAVVEADGSTEAVTQLLKSSHAPDLESEKKDAADKNTDASVIVDSAVSIPSEDLTSVSSGEEDTDYNANNAPGFEPTKPEESADAPQLSAPESIPPHPEGEDTPAILTESDVSSTIPETPTESAVETELQSPLEPAQPPQGTDEEASLEHELSIEVAHDIPESVDDEAQGVPDAEAEIPDVELKPVPMVVDSTEVATSSIEETSVSVAPDVIRSVELESQISEADENPTTEPIALDPIAKVEGSDFSAEASLSEPPTIPELIEVEDADSSDSESKTTTTLEESAASGPDTPLAEESETILVAESDPVSMESNIETTLTDVPPSEQEPIISSALATNDELHVTEVEGSGEPPAPAPEVEDLEVSADHGSPDQEEPREEGAVADSTVPQTGSSDVESEALVASIPPLSAAPTAPIADADTPVSGETPSLVSQPNVLLVEVEESHPVEKDIPAVVMAESSTTEISAVAQSVELISGPDQEEPSLPRQEPVIEVGSLLVDADSTVVQEVSPTFEEQSPVTEEPSIAEEGSLAVEDVTLGVEEGPSVVEEETQAIEHEPLVVGEGPAVVEEESAVIEHEPLIVEEDPAVAEESPAVEEGPAVIEEESTVVEEEQLIVGTVPPAIVEEESPALETEVVVETDIVISGETEPLVGVEHTPADEDESPVVEAGPFAVAPRDLASGEGLPTISGEETSAPESEVVEGKHSGGTPDNGINPLAINAFSGFVEEAAVSVAPEPSTTDFLTDAESGIPSVDDIAGETGDLAAQAIPRLEERPAEDGNITEHVDSVVSGFELTLAQSTEHVGEADVPDHERTTGDIPPATPTELLADVIAPETQTPFGADPPILESDANPAITELVVQESIVADAPTPVPVTEELGISLPDEPLVIQPTIEVGPSLGGDQPEAEDINESSGTTLDMPDAVSNEEDESEEQDRIPSPGLLTPNDAEIEHPKSPWTPSYSVTTQGSGVSSPDAVEDSDIAELEQLPPSVIIPEVVGGDLSAEVPIVHSAASNLLGDTEVLETEEIPSAEAKAKADTPELVVDTTSLDLPAEEARPTSPWTPSYSVTTQGSPLHGDIDLGQVNTPPVEDIPLFADNPEGILAVPVEESIPPADAPELTIISDLNHDTISLTHPSIRDTAPSTEEFAINNEFTFGSSPDEVRPQVALEHTSDTTPEISGPELTREEETSTSLLTPQEDLPERPKSPWTPSYSVTSQGSPLLDNGDLHQQEEPSTSLSPQEDLPDRPKSPWTPSYSVTSQGSPLLGNEDLDQQGPPLSVVQTQEDLSYDVERRVSTSDDLTSAIPQQISEEDTDHNANNAPMDLVPVQESADAPESIAPHPEGEDTSIVLTESDVSSTTPETPAESAVETELESPSEPGQSSPPQGTDEEATLEAKFEHEPSIEVAHDVSESVDEEAQGVPDAEAVTPNVESEPAHPVVDSTEEVTPSIEETSVSVISDVIPVVEPQSHISEADEDATTEPTSSVPIAIAEGSDLSTEASLLEPFMIPEPIEVEDADSSSSLEESAASGPDTPLAEESEVMPVAESDPVSAESDIKTTLLTDVPPSEQEPIISSALATNDELHVTEVEGSGEPPAPAPEVEDLEVSADHGSPDQEEPREEGAVADSTVPQTGSSDVESEALVASIPLSAVPTSPIADADTPVSRATSSSESQHNIPLVKVEESHPVEKDIPAVVVAEPSTTEISAVARSVESISEPDQEEPSLSRHEPVIEVDSLLVDADSTVVQEVSPTFEEQSSVTEEPSIAEEGSLAVEDVTLGVEEGPSVVEEEPQAIEHEPPAFEEDPAVVEDSTAVVEGPAVFEPAEEPPVEEEPPVVEEEPPVVEEEQSIVGTVPPAVEEESPALEAEAVVEADMVISRETESLVDVKHAPAHKDESPPADTRSFAVAQRDLASGEGLPTISVEETSAPESEIVDGKHSSGTPNDEINPPAIHVFSGSVEEAAVSVTPEPSTTDFLTDAESGIPSLDDIAGETGDLAAQAIPRLEERPAEDGDITEHVDSAVSAVLEPTLAQSNEHVDAPDHEWTTGDITPATPTELLADVTAPETHTSFEADPAILESDVKPTITESVVQEPIVDDVVTPEPVTEEPGVSLPDGPSEIQPTVEVGPSFGFDESEAEVTNESSSTTLDMPDAVSNEEDESEEQDRIPSPGLLTPNDSEIDRPKSPWTPSYSVTTQGSGVSSPDAVEDSDIAELEQLPPSVIIPEVVGGDLSAEVSIIHPAASTPLGDTEVLEMEETPSAEAKADTPELVVDTTSLDLPAEEARPTSPWTPSYSVTTQGSPLHGDIDLGQVNTPPVEDIPLFADNPEGILAVPVEESIPPADASEVTVINDLNHDTSSLSHPNIRDSVPNTEELEINNELTFASSPDEARAQVALEHTRDTTPEISGPELTREEETSTSLLTPQEDLPERPKSPWTPSYSVTSQGSPLLGNEDLDQQGSPLSAVQTQEDLSYDVEQRLSTSEDLISTTPQQIVLLDYDEGHTETEVIPDPDPDTRDLATDAEGTTNDQALAPAIEVTPTFGTFLDKPVENPLVVLKDRDNFVPVPVAVGDLSGDESRELLPLQVDIPERPKSPWTPSYSVTTQGSPPHDNTDLAKVEPHPLTTGVDDQPVAGTVEGPLSLPASELDQQRGDNSHVTEEGEPTIAKDTISDSFNTQEIVKDSVVEFEAFVTLAAQDPLTGGASPRDVALDEAPVVDIEPVTEAAPNNVPDLRLASGNENDPDADDDDDDSTSDVLLTPQECPSQERPASPWTPSYSVTQQGPGLSDASVNEDGLHELDQLPGPAAQSSIGPSTILTAIQPVDSPESQTFPTRESLDEGQKPAKPVVPHLAPVDENSGIYTTSAVTDTPSQDTRTRLESTTSSRFFPGGWFSSSPKVPGEGRTSMESARGEFIPSKPTSPVFEIPETSAPASTPVDGVEVVDEKKSRWCIVM